MKETIIALKPTAFTSIQIQTSIFQRNNDSYINSVNILFDNKIIKKIKVENKLIENTSENIENISREYFISKLKPTIKHTVNKKAKQKAAANLMDDLNLFK